MAELDPEMSNLRLLQRIHQADGSIPPTFEGMEFVRFVRQGRGFEAAYAWAIYISHDPCHDGRSRKANRNTVLAFHRSKGTFKILGRELPLKLARAIATGRE